MVIICCVLNVLYKLFHSCRMQENVDFNKFDKYNELILDQRLALQVENTGEGAAVRRLAAGCRCGAASLSLCVS